MPLSLSSSFDHQWELQLTAQLRLRNITAAHVRVATVLCRLLAGGETEPTHELLAALAACGPTTVKDALRRLRAVGLLAWEQQWRPFGGRRRQLANRYRLTLPAGEAVARPELRRCRKVVGVRRPSKPEIQPTLPSYPNTEAGVARAALAAIAARRQQELLLNKKIGWPTHRGGRPGQPRVR